MKKLWLIGAICLLLAITGCQAATESSFSQTNTEPELTEEEKAALHSEEQSVPLLEEAVTESTTAKDSFILYEEPVRHIFFHSLIVDPDLAFDGDDMSNGYNYWMTTVDEFKSMLVELYENDFVLIDIHDIEHPMVPSGKKPLVLSVDDVNYYEYMEQDGFARKLVLDENNNVKNLYIDPEGKEYVGDYDVVPILDAFVKEHPDFSLKGAKGVIALTGYEGTLGYDTHDQESPTYEQDKIDAKAVADRMKETGWLFAVHGWGHRNASKISYDSLAWDTARWKEEVGSLVGDTDIYIYPYGAEVEYPSDKLSYLQSEGYRFFCGVWTKAYVEITDTYVRQSRCNLDGFNMITRPEALADLFEVEKVLDQSRPELE